MHERPGRGNAVNLEKRERLSDLLAALPDLTDTETQELWNLTDELRLGVLTEKRRLGTLTPEQDEELRVMALRMLNMAAQGKDVTS